MKDECSSLMMIIRKLDRLIDIWNNPYSKGLSFINCPEHKYIKELESILLIFTKWRDANKAAKIPWAGFSAEIFNDLS